MILLTDKGIMEEGPEMRAKELVEHIIGAAGFVPEDIISHAEMNEIIQSVRPNQAGEVPVWNMPPQSGVGGVWIWVPKKCMLRRNRLVYAVRNTG